MVVNPLLGLILGIQRVGAIRLGSDANSKRSLRFGTHSTLEAYQSISVSRESPVHRSIHRSIDRWMRAHAIASFELNVVERYQKRINLLSRAFFAWCEIFAQRRSDSRGRTTDADRRRGKGTGGQGIGKLGLAFRTGLETLISKLAWFRL